MDGDDIIKSTTAEEIQKYIELSKEGPKAILFVDFFTEWCGPCQLIDGILREVHAEHKDRAYFMKVDCDELEDESE